MITVGIIEVDEDNECILVMERGGDERIYELHINYLADESIRNMLQKYLNDEISFHTLSNWRTYFEINIHDEDVLRTWEITQRKDCC